MVLPTVERIHLWKDPPNARGTKSVPAEVYFEPEMIGFGISLLQNSLMKRSCSANTSSFQQNRQRIAFATRKIRAGEKLITSHDFESGELSSFSSQTAMLSTNFTFCKFPDLMKQYRAESNPLVVCEIDACSTKCPKIELLADAEIPFLTPDSSFKTKIKTLAMKACAEVRKARMEGTGLTDEEILRFIIIHSTSLCGILAIPSHDIVLCEQLLVVFMRVLYCDHQKQYKHLSLEKYFDGFTESMAERIYSYHLEGTGIAPENRK